MISYQLVKQYLNNAQGLRDFANAEGGRFLKKKFTRAAQALVPWMRPEYLRSSEKVDIRAQLLDREKHEQVMDFLVERKEATIHVLNAVSPGFTSAFEFAKVIVQ